MTKSKREELIKLMQEHPECELKFLVYGVEFEYGWYTVINEKDMGVCLKEIGEYNDDLVGDYDEIFERVQNDFADNPEYVNLSDEEYDKICKDYIKENVEFKEYIVVYL